MWRHRPPVNGDDDFGDDRAQELLAVAVRGARRVEDLAHVGTGARHPRQFLFGQRGRPAGLLGAQVGLGAAQRAELVLPGTFHGAGDQPVLRLDRVVLAAGAVGLVAGTLDGQLEGGQPGPVLGPSASASARAVAVSAAGSSTVNSSRSTVCSRRRPPVLWQTCSPP